MITKLRKFLQLSYQEQILLVKAVFLLGFIRIGLKFLSFQTLQHFLTKIFQSTVKSQIPAQTYVNKVVWAVKLTSRYIQGVRCLAIALATQILLAQSGYSTDLQIGFTRNQKGQMSAHAWLEREGKVVVGGAGKMSHYIRVPLHKIEHLNQKEWQLLS